MAAWLNPASLPMPETLKEPAYPWLISRLGVSFAAGQALSLLAGVLLPWAAYALGRRRALDRPTALLAALLVAASPLAMLQSVRVMVESLFALVVTSMFLFASRDLGAPGGRPLWRDLVAGALFGAGVPAARSDADPARSPCWCCCSKAARGARRSSPSHSRSPSESRSRRPSGCATCGSSIRRSTATSSRSDCGPMSIMCPSPPASSIRRR
jgi:hypothetical protein